MKLRAFCEQGKPLPVAEWPVFNFSKGKKMDFLVYRGIVLFFGNRWFKTVICMELDSAEFVSRITPPFVLNPSEYPCVCIGRGFS
jgi:hypothetical protein